MAAEIDRLEINISANATDAESKVSALATSLEKLAGASGTSANGLYKDADGIAAIKDAAKNVGSVTEAIEKLTSSFSSISSIQPAQNLSQLAESFKPLEDISRSISGFANTRNVDRVMENISSIAMGLTSLSQIDASGVERARAFFEGFEDFGINVDAVRLMGQLTRSISNLSKIEFSETLSDNLRLFIDTVHAITEDDAQRIADIAEAAQGLSNLGGEFDISREDVEEKNTEKTKHSFEGVTHAIETATNAAKEFVNAIGKGGGTIAKGSIGWILSPLKKVGSGFANAAKKAGEFFSSIKRIAMYRAIRTAMKAISQGFQEGRENLYQYSLLINGEFAKSMDMAATSFLYLKNSIGAATAPLTNYFVPIMDRMVDRIVEVINRFNELTAVLTGASTWTKAIKYPTQWQEAADDANAAAKKLKTTMLGFDELNVIEPNSSGSGGADDSGLDYSRMFTEVKVDMDLSEGMKSSMPAILEPIMSAWESTGAETLDKIANSWKNIKELVGGVRDTFLEIWENGTGQRSVELLLEITGNIARTFGNIASSIKIAWDNAGAGKRILQGVWNVSNNIGTVFSRVWNDIANWAATLDFSPAMDALGDLFEAIQRLTDPDGALSRAFVKVWNKIFLPLGSWAIEEGVPAAIDMLTLSIEGLTDAFELIEPGLDKFIDFIAAVGNWTGDNIVGIANALKALRQINSGEDVDDETLAALEKADRTTSELFDWNGDGSSWYDSYSKWMQKFTAGELGGDETNASDLVDYDAGYAEHVKAMQENWDAPTEISSGFERWFKGGQGIDFKTSNATWGDDNEDAWNFVNAWLAGLGLTSIGGKHSLKEAVGDDGLLKFFADETDSPVMDTLYAGSVATKDMGFWDAWKAGLGISGKSESSEKSGTDALKNTATITPNISAQESFAKAWVDGFETIKKKSSETWTSFSTTWTSGWGSVKKKVSEYGEAWSSGWLSIKQGASEGWNNVKQTLGEGWEGLKQHVSNFGENWSEGWKSIKKGAGETWENIKGGIKTFGDEAGGKIFDFVETWKSGWRTINEFVSKIVGKISGSISGIWSGSDGKHGLKGIINSMLGGVESFLNFIVRGINFFIEQLNKISFSAPEWLKAAGSAFGLNVPDTIGLSINTISAFNLPRLATGGVVDTGQLFIARERGAELVGSYNNRTAVMNNDQIVDAVSDGVYRAMMSAMQNSEQGGSEIKVYLDGRQIAARSEEIKRENGLSLLGGVIYST